MTLPYPDGAWNAIGALGTEVDRVLAEHDVRLTMGGEPTFVAADDPEGPEWNVAALGPTKRRYARKLIERLHARFAPGGLLHEGQGKWYPGEPLPRWALSSYFRKDGGAIWSDPSLFAGDEAGGDTAEDARSFIRALATLLGADPEFAVPGYEDAWYYLWRERRLPINVDPFDSRLDDENERARLARVFEQTLTAVVGYALPLTRSASSTAPCWSSGPWFLRPGRLYLIPGDSPMGFRLPLEGLPWVAPGGATAQRERDPFASRDPLPPRANFTRASGEPRFHMRTASAERPSPTESPPERFQSHAATVRTALCVEPRGGVLHVFMPPLALVEDYLELCAAIEAAAAAQGKRVRIEGYHPPGDPRVGRLQVTPDPGVLEVNIHPAHSWAEAVSTTEILYEEARQVGLRAEKFMLDGRHCGTGGGNHIVLGGPTAADSPPRPSFRAAGARGAAFVAASEQTRATFAAAAERALVAAIFDAEPPGTLRSAVAASYRVARSLRDRISGDMWRAIVGLDRDLHERPSPGPRARQETLALVDEILLALAAFSGLGIDSMSRGLGWRFLDMGRRLERGLHLAALLRATLESCIPEGPLLEAILEVADSSMTYRRRYLATLQPAPVVDLLLADETNPRAVLYQLRTLAEHIHELPRDPDATGTPQEMLLLEAMALVQLAGARAICALAEGGDGSQLLDLLDRLTALLRETSDSVSGVYLNHASARRSPGDE